MRRFGPLLEWFIQVVIVVSIVLHFVEVEFKLDDEPFFDWAEYAITAIFTVEYIVRWILSRSLLYPFRLSAIVDLLALLPFYLVYLSKSVVDLRGLRLIRTLRMLRLFKLYRHSTALHNIQSAFQRVRYEFGVVGFAVLIVWWCSSVAVFELEKDRPNTKFENLTDAMWYVLTTLTTVGYGDLVPETSGGRLVAAATMIAGLGLFGTFVSLVGSAFLEEIRKGSGFAGDPSEQPNPDRFDAAATLKWLDQQPADENTAASQAMLRKACEQLLRDARRVS